MDLSQIAYVTLLAAALALGRPSLDISLVMVCNLILTMTLAADPQTVAVADLAAAVILMGGQSRAQIVAFIFAAMAIFETIAHRVSLPNSTIYTITDAMAYLQLGVVGGADRGMGFVRRALDRRLPDHRNSLAVGDHPDGSLARHSAPHRRG